MLTMTTDDDRGYMELTVDGDIHAADYEAVVAKVDEMLKLNPKLDVLEVVRTIGAIDRQVWWRDLDFHLHHRGILRCAAVVSDKMWVGPVVRLFASLHPAEIRFFPEMELPAARAWVQGGHDTPEVRAAA